MSKPLFVVDTNILFEWVLSYYKDSLADSAPQKRAMRRAARRFFETEDNEIVIPGIVLTELHGVFMQKDIDLNRYPLWYRNRRAALSVVHRAIFGQARHITLGEYDYDGDFAHELCIAKIDHAGLTELRRRERFRSTGSRNGGRAPRINKFLDGMDSAILAIAWGLASRHPARSVRLMTLDKSLRIAVRSLKGQTVCRVSFPDNLTVTYPRA